MPIVQAYWSLRLCKLGRRQTLSKEKRKTICTYMTINDGGFKFKTHKTGRIFKCKLFSQYLF